MIRYMLLLSVLVTTPALAQMRATYAPAPGWEQRKHQELEQIMAAAHARQDAAREQQKQKKAAECASSFRTRLADAKRALAEYAEYRKAYEAARPAVEWWGQHCRFLSELENAIRKNDDPNAFVCDTKKGRPKNLTAELIMQFNTEAPGPDQHFGYDNDQCREFDRADHGVELVLGGVNAAPDFETAANEMLVLCYEDTRPTCVKARESVEAARAKRAAKQAEPE